MVFNNKQRHRIRGVFIAFILINSFTICSIIPLISEEVIGTNHTVQEVQNLINEINTTLTNYNSTLCSFNDDENHSIDAVNYTEDILLNAFILIYQYNVSLPNYSQYQELLNEVYDNLTEIKNQFDAVSSDVTNISQLEQEWDNKSIGIYNFLNDSYNQEDVTEDDYDNITAELLNNTQFNIKLDSYLNTSFEYISIHNNVTDECQNITSKLWNKSIIHYNELYNYEHNTPISKSNSTEKINSVNTTSTNSNTNSKTGSSPLKLVSHNCLKYGSVGETAFEKADAMDIDYIRYDFSWKKLEFYYSSYLWDKYNLPNDPDDNYWYDRLDNSLRWTKEHNMETLVVTKCDKPPDILYDDLKDEYDDHWNDYKNDMDFIRKLRKPFKDERRMSLWASWAELNLATFPYDGPHGYLEELLDVLSDGVKDSNYEIVGFNVENEPNLDVWGVKNHYKKLDIPTGRKYDVAWKIVWVWDGWNTGWKLQKKYTWKTTFTTYTTRRFIQDMLDTIKDFTDNDNYLDDTITTVNLYCIYKSWTNSNRWKILSNDKNLDILGIDVYYDQICRKNEPLSSTKSRANTVGKDWWLIETAGAEGPGDYEKNPTADAVESYAKKAKSYNAQVVGFYRLWGNYGGGLDYDKAYNIYTNPSTNPTPNQDKNGIYYWETIRDLFDT